VNHFNPLSRPPTWTPSEKSNRNEIPPAFDWLSHPFLRIHGRIWRGQGILLLPGSNRSAHDVGLGLRRGRRICVSNDIYSIRHGSVIPIFKSVLARVVRRRVQRQTASMDVRSRCNRVCDRSRGQDPKCVPLSAGCNVLKRRHVGYYQKLDLDLRALFRTIIGYRVHIYGDPEQHLQLRDSPLSDPSLDPLTVQVLNGMAHLTFRCGVLIVISAFGGATGVQLNPLPANITHRSHNSRVRTWIQPQAQVECDYCSRPFVSDNALHNHCVAKADHPYCGPCGRLFGGQQALDQVSLSRFQR
jgi:hypothetical protein